MQVQYVYHGFFCLIFDKTTVAQEQKVFTIWIVIVWSSLIEVNSVLERKSIDTHVFVVSFCHDEMPLASIKQLSASIIHNTFRHRRVSFHTFVGQSFLK